MSFTIAEALLRSFAMFETAYPNSWKKGANLAMWEMLLDGVEAQEIADAAKAWCTAQPPNPFPPSPAQLKSLVPRFCTCGRCWRCNRRAIESHGRALERGAAGYDPSRVDPLPAASSAKRLTP